MPEIMDNDDKQKPEAITLAPPCDDGSREYQAFRGKTTVGQDMILLVPHGGSHDRYLPVSDIRLMDPAKTGREIIIEYSGGSVHIVGRNLRAGAHAIANRLCGSIEAFDPIRRDRPDNPLAPYVESIRFYDPPRKKAEGDEDRPARGEKPKLVQ